MPTCTCACGWTARLELDLRSSYSSDTQLPRDAKDTGYRLDDQQLWRAGDGNSVYVVTDENVQRWPGLTKPLYCK